MELDKWQKDVLNTNGNIVLRSGRQVGKSTVISIKSAEYAVKNPKKSVMIISATERQAYLLFSKVLAYIADTYKSRMKTGKDRPTKSEIKLKNGSVIRCLPTGLDGLGIRGYTVDLLIADEAAFIPEEVFNSTIPSMLTKGMNIILLSTPLVKQGYFYNCFNDPNFTSFHVSSEEVAQARPEPMRSTMLQFIEQEKKVKSKVVFAREYLGEFMDEVAQVFPDKLIRDCMILQRRNRVYPERQYFLGVDVARMGEDSSVFTILDRTDKESVHQIENIITTKTLTTQTSDLIVELEDKYKFKKIYIDDGGLGVAVFDQLLREDSTKRKVIALNNARRSLDREDKKRKKLLKEDMYMNLLHMMEAKKIKLLDDPEIFLSLKSCLFELSEDKQSLKITSSDNHCSEALIRAAWCNTDKGLNIWCR